jgi:peptidoglycan/xylan/chitin deacetylase (PgdA/CDA1 family)
MTPGPLMMNVSTVKARRQAGMGIGAHTVSHPILAGLNHEAASEEVRRSKQFLEATLDEPVSLFAYPNGRVGDDYDAGTVALVREIGFDAALATDWGAARFDTDPFQLPRFTPWDRSRLAFGARLARNLL